MLPTPVLRLLNVLDGDYLESEEGYEGQCYLSWLFTSFLTGLPGTSRPKILGASSSIQWGCWILWSLKCSHFLIPVIECVPQSSCGKALICSVIVFGIGASFGKSEAGDMQRAELHLSLSGLGWGWGWGAAKDLLESGRLFGVTAP